MNMSVTKRKSINPNGKYVWLRTQIGSMLKNQTYLGHVINGKKEQLSPKIKKGKLKEKKEYIIVENMHEPIISQEVWDKVQERLASFKTDNKKKYEHLLKDLIFCSECGANTVIRHNKSKDKKGNVCWEGNAIVCKRRNSQKSLCSNKPIGEHIIMKVIKDIIKKEVEMLKYSKKDLKAIYDKSKSKNKKENINSVDIKEKELKKIEKRIEVLYTKKLNKLISIEEFKKEYSILSEEKNRLNMEVKKIDNQEKNGKENNITEVEYIKIAEKYLKMENPDIEIIKKLIKRIEFDRNKNIVVSLTFTNNCENKEYIISGKEYMKK